MQLPLNVVKVISAERKSWLAFLTVPSAMDRDDDSISDPVEVECRDHALVNMPGNAMAYQFFDSLLVILEIEGVRHVYEQSAETDWDHRVNPSPWYFPGGTLMRRNEVPLEVLECWLAPFPSEAWVQSHNGYYYQYGGRLQHPAEVI